jgi:hypothetical protein
MWKISKVVLILEKEFHMIEVHEKCEYGVRKATESHMMVLGQ